MDASPVKMSKRRKTWNLRKRGVDPSVNVLVIPEYSMFKGSWK